MNAHRFLQTAALAALTGSVPALALAQMAPATTPNSVDRQFVQQAMVANAQEINTADVQRYSRDPNVRLFAQTMVRDHGQAASQLAAIANQLNIPYPKAGVVKYAPDEAAPPAGGSSTGKAGPNVAPDLDQSRAYMRDQVTDHQQAIALYKNEMKNGSSQELRTYAGKALPQLENHLTMAKEYMAVGRITPEPTPSP